MSPLKNVCVVVQVDGETCRQICCERTRLDEARTARARGRVGVRFGANGHGAEAAAQHLVGDHELVSVHHRVRRKLVRVDVDQLDDPVAVGA